MIVDFGNKIAFDLFHSGECKKLPKNLWRRAIHLLDIMEAVEKLDDLKSKSFPPNIRLHKLKGERKSEWKPDGNFPHGRMETGWKFRLALCKHIVWAFTWLFRTPQK